MQNVLLALDLILALALIVVIMVQRTSQDGGLTGGGSTTMGGLFTARGSANLLTRATAILATLFIVTSLASAIYASRNHETVTLGDKIGQISEQAQPEAPIAPATPEVPVLP